MLWEGGESRPPFFRAHSRRAVFAFRQSCGVRLPTRALEALERHAALQGDVLSASLGAPAG
jgi:hypothetical protein